MAIEDLIQQLADKIGIDESVAKMATGKTMAMVKSVGGDDLFAKISDAIPGAAQLADTESAPDAPQAESGGGLLGTLTGLASSVLGGSAGEAMGLTSALNDAGIGMDKMSGFVSTIIEFIKDKAGEEVTDQLLSKVPMLKSILG
jgi:hypothetical protein